jgi:hypothetical protein
VRQNVRPAPAGHKGRRHGGPSGLYGIARKGRIAVGDGADLTAVDLGCKSGEACGFLKKALPVFKCHIRKLKPIDLRYGSRKFGKHLSNSME